MIPRSSRGGWGFNIDYAKAIADDDARIAWALRSIEHGLYRIGRGERVAGGERDGLGAIWSDSRETPATTGGATQTGRTTTGGGPGVGGFERFLSSVLL